MKNAAADLKSTDLYATAVHEAGHAVAMIVLRRDPSERFLRVEVLAKNHGIPESERRSQLAGEVLGAQFWQPYSRKGRTEWFAQAYARSGYPEQRIMLDCMLREAAVSYAGLSAEIRHVNPQRNRRHYAAWLVTELRDGDANCARFALADHYAVTGKSALKSVVLGTVELIRANWGAVTALADALMTKHCIEYDEAAEIVEPLLKPVADWPRDARRLLAA